MSKNEIGTLKKLHTYRASNKRSITFGYDLEFKNERMPVGC